MIKMRIVKKEQKRKNQLLALDGTIFILSFDFIKAYYFRQSSFDIIPQIQSISSSRTLRRRLMKESQMDRDNDSSHHFCR